MQPSLLQVQSQYQLPKLKTLPLRDQPAYRVTSNAAACSLAELLAAVIGGQQQIETAEALLARFGGSVQRIYQAHVAELASVRGVGQPTAVRIKAALAMGLRLSEPEDERIPINSPADAAALVQYEMGFLQQEYLKVMLLDTRNRMLDIVEIYHGNLN